MTNTGTITITWDEKGIPDFDASTTIPDKVLLAAGAGLYTAALARMRQIYGDRWAGNAWRGLKEIVENEVFVYTVRVPRWLRGQEENTDE